MLVKLTLENFLAHGRTVLELGPGLTVLVGPNNSGKSAVVEALRCLATNPPPKHFIRHGAKLARVEAEFSDGTRVAWIRKDRSGGYELLRPGAEEPEAFWKLQGKVPTEIMDVLRLNLVQLESVGRTVDVHLGNQKEPIFLLNEPPSAMASFFASSTESAHLLAMQKALQHKVRERKADERKARQRMAGLEQNLRALAPLPDIELRLDAARAEHQAIHQAMARLPALAASAKSLRRTRLAVDGLRRNACIQARVEQPPKLQPVAELARAVLNLRQTRQAVAVLRQRADVQARAVEPPDLQPAAQLAQALLLRGRLAQDKARAERLAMALKPLREPPTLFPAAQLARHLELYSVRSKALATVSRRNQALEPLAASPGLFDAARLSRWLSDRRKLEARMAVLKALAGRMANLGRPPEPARVQGLTETAAGLRRLKHQEAELRHRLAGQDASLAACETRIAARLAEIGSCPLCGGHIDAGNFLHRQSCAHGTEHRDSEERHGC